MAETSSPMSRKQTVDFFTRALAAFQSSHDAFGVLRNIPPASSAAAAAAAAAAAKPPSPPPSAVKRLIILDSSFNPPTRAHAQMAVSALRAADQESRLMLLLAVNNADKKVAVPAPLPTRLGLMDAFARDLVQHHAGLFQQQGIDLGVTTEPFFHEKARCVAEHTPAGATEQEQEQMYLCGFDTVIRILDTKYYKNHDHHHGGGGGESSASAALDAFFRRARLRVSIRGNDAWGTPEEQRAYVERLAAAGGGLEQLGGNAAWADRIELVEGVQGVVSSSIVREAARRRGDELAGLVGDEVRRWIEEECLYDAGAVRS